jgi:hypothetical protein
VVPEEDPDDEGEIHVRGAWVAAWVYVEADDVTP